MKSMLNLVAICAVVALAGCNSTKSNSVAPGAVGEKSSCCSGEKAACCKSGEAKTCPATGKTNTVSPGAVGEQKSGCCSASKASCTGAKTSN